MITEKQIIENAHISDENVQIDIDETQAEINSYEIILHELYKRPQENRVEIYLNEGRILKRKSFIEDLKAIQNFRKQTPQIQ